MFAGGWKARALWVLALGTPVLLSALPARGADREETGRALFDAGVKAYQTGEYEAAIASFREAYRLTQRQGLLFSLAQALRRSHERSGRVEHLREALRFYARYLSSNPRGAHRSEAESWLEQLRRAPGADGWESAPEESPARTQLVIAVNVSSARVTLDGQPLGTLPHAAEVAPGKHRIVAVAEGHEPYRRDLDVRSGATVPLNIELKPTLSRLLVSGNAGAELFIDGVRAGHLPLTARPVSPGRHSIEVRQSGYYTVQQTLDVGPGARERVLLVGSPTARRTASWVLIGAGATSAVAGGVLGFMALQKQEDARSLQDRPGSAAAFEDAIAARNSLRLGALLGLGFGAAAAIGGTISMATEGYGPSRRMLTTSSSLGLGYQLSPLGVACSGAF